MVEPAYSFTIPSLHDDLALDCRIYYPGGLAEAADTVHGPQLHTKGAVLAHPYAPLGGGYDDLVVLSVTETLLEHGYVVVTFNFRGAGSSQGKTSWTGRAEIADYMSVLGLTVYYLDHLSAPRDSEPLIHGTPGGAQSPLSTHSVAVTSQAQSTRLVLGGYSYGSLILARLPPVPAILKRFEDATTGTAAAEIILRARTMAKQTLQTLHEQQTPTTPRGRTLKPEDAGRRSLQHARPSPMTMGGEETIASDRRRSKDSRRSVDVVRKSVEMPRRVAANIRKRSNRSVSKPTTSDQVVVSPTNGCECTHPEPIVSYLFISPVLLPFTNVLSPPGPPIPSFGIRKQAVEGTAESAFLQHPTLAIFGSQDAFTASRRLRNWAARQAQDARQGAFEWHQIDGAGHFWREAGVMQALQNKIVAWTTAISA